MTAPENDEMQQRVVRVTTHARRMWGHWNALLSEVGTGARGAYRQALRNDQPTAPAEQSSALPCTSLALAAAAGYVLAGGLFARPTRTVARWSLRFLAIPLLRAQWNTLMSSPGTDTRWTRGTDLARGARRPLEA